MDFCSFQKTICSAMQCYIFHLESLKPEKKHVSRTRKALGRVHTSTRLNSLHFVSQWSVGSSSRPEPKSNRLVLVTDSTHPPSFVITCPQIFETSCYISFLAPSLNNEEPLWKQKIVRSGFGFSPKSNQFFSVTHPTCQPSFIRIHPQLFVLLCSISFWPCLSMVTKKKMLEKRTITVSTVDIFNE